MDGGNLYAGIPPELPEEITEVLARGTGIRIERIVSEGQPSDPGVWYDQEQNEWVLLIQGEAELRFEDDHRSVRLTGGNYMNIPAHARYQVEWTKQNEVTIWFAVFLSRGNPGLSARGRCNSRIGA